MIVFGIGAGIGNVIQAESAIACLRAKGLKVYATKNCTWPDGWRVLDGRVDGYVDDGDSNVKHFIQSCWYRPFNFPNAKTYYVPYEPINQVDLHWKAANQFYYREYGENLDKPSPPKLEPEVTQWDSQKYIAVHPARTLNNEGWKLKLYKDWENLIIGLGKYFLKRVMVVGTSHDNGISGKPSCYSLYGEDCRRSWLPLEHAANLKDRCSALITSASGWAFLGAAIGIPTFVLWGPDSLARNRPLGDNVHILKHDNCQECFEVKTLRTEIPECPYNNKCMDHTSEEIIDEIEKVLSL